MNLGDRFSKMRSGSSPRAQRLLNRALFFAGGLIILWVLVQLMPAPEFGTDAPVHSDEAGTVAARPDTPATGTGIGLVTPGRIAAMLLLAGGGAFAYYLHRRQRDAPGRKGSPIESVGSFDLAPNQQLRLVACGDEVLLLGVTAQQITLLKSYARTEFEASTSSDGAPSTHTAAPAFAEVLRSYAGRTTS